MKPMNKILLTLTLALAVTTAGLAAHTAVYTSAAPRKEPAGVELPIVMYHHVLKEQSRLNKYTISPTEFRADMQYIIDQGYTPIVMRDLINHAKNGAPLPEKPIMITFDDGYESFHEYVFPILREYRFKAVFSIVGRYADQYSEVDDHHIRYSHATWNQLALMRDSGLVEIQNHSYNLHENDKGRKGSKRKPGESALAYRELLISDLGKVQRECEEHLDWTPTTFTYPFGHISAEALPILKEMGFQAALTCEEKLNYITGDPEQLFNLHRYNRPHDVGLRALMEKAHAKT